MIGLALLAIGAVLIWAAFTKRGDAVLSALQISLPDAGSAVAASGDTVAGDSVSPTHSVATPDSGSHQGLDANGAIITINKDYGSMTDAEKDAANAFARQIGNLGSTA